MKTKQKHTDGFLRTRMLITAIFFLPLLTLNAQDFTKTYYNEKYDVDQGASLVIQDKFGDIHCQAWDESSVSVKVTVKVDASSQEKADRVFDKIDITLTGSRTKVEGKTSVGNISNANYSIDYEIHMPRWINIDLDNQFGNIYLDETDGTAKIELQYGDMEANSFNGTKTDLTIKFSNVETGYIKDGNVNIEYSELDSKGADNMKLYSRFSELTIEKIGMLNLDSQYDEIKTGSAGQIISVSRFSGLKFDKINGDFDFDIEYGDLEAKHISASFKVGKVRNSFAGADLGFDPKASMTINAEMEFGELKYPKSHSSMSEETTGYTTNIYKGRIGASTSPASQLTIDSKNADVKISFEE
jgi:cellobiose-specific phosphotransferase system component IIB